MHELLDDELRFRYECQERNGGESHSMWISRLDALLEKAGDQLEVLGVADWSKANPTEAEAALQVIDRTLASEGYATCIRTELLSTSFSEPISLSSPLDFYMNVEGRDCALLRFPSYRREFISRHWRTGLSPIDCDLGAMLYIAIAQRENIPLSFVDVPGHNFIRWNLIDGTYINWDTNDASVYADDEYRSAVPLTTSIKFSVEEEIANKYLVNMSLEEVTGYYHGLLANYINPQHAPCIEELFNMPNSEIQRTPTSINNFAWAFSTMEYFSNTAYVQIAIDFAERATSIRPQTSVYWNTLSCAYAAAGRFDDAIRVESEQVSKQSLRIESYRNGQNCYIASVACGGDCQ
ncbi:MAG: hypothetical protein AAGG50_03030 [Bacteroidota bacterium]